MDRKYRQRGYEDSPRTRSENRPQPKPETFGPKTPKFPDAHQVSRCAGCGKILPAEVDFNGRCPHCGFELHSCKQCAHFDTSARFECTQPITARIPKKDARNECGYYKLRVTLERQTSPGASRPDNPRAAFEALFKK
ncbi:MAG TPA: hypothetical protein VGX94_08830 [Terriglobia bacterium]|nr:hypothetical protein [Terriglobia bacterium]HEV2499055.1 hypothetical protein [Terriglobia bacterium]